jgi:acyl-CoA thioesterase
MTEFVYVNPDLSVHLVRPPEGEWVALRSASVAHTTGVGLARSELFDRDGRIGLAAQSLFVDTAG